MGNNDRVRLMMGECWAPIPMLLGHYPPSFLSICNAPFVMLLLKGQPPFHYKIDPLHVHILVYPKALPFHYKIDYLDMVYSPLIT